MVLFLQFVWSYCTIHAVSFIRLPRYQYRFTDFEVPFMTFWGTIYEVLRYRLWGFEVPFMRFWDTVLQILRYRLWGFRASVLPLVRFLFLPSKLTIFYFIISQKSRYLQNYSRKDLIRRILPAEKHLMKRKGTFQELGCWKNQNINKKHKSFTAVNDSTVGTVYISAFCFTRVHKRCSKVQFKTPLLTVLKTIE